MKIKLQDYSLISNKWIDNEIAECEKYIEDIDVNEWYYVERMESLIAILNRLKQQLIPSEKLASAVYEQCTVIGTALSFREQEAHKPIYLKSEIEL